MSPMPPLHTVLVVGAGPAGVSAVLALRARGLSVRWVDPAFASGRLARLKGVPCNTKVDLLLGPKCFRRPLFDKVQETVTPSLQRMQDRAYELDINDPSALGWTTLDMCKDVYDAVTLALCKQQEVFPIRGTVASLSPINSDQQTTWAMGNSLAGWRASIGRTDDSGLDAGNRKLDSEQRVTDIAVRHVVLATGVKPRPPTVFGAMTGEDSFHVEALVERLGLHARESEDLHQRHVAVLGNSHTAAIVLSRLEPLVSRFGLRVVNFIRHPPRFAEWMPIANTYRYNSSGLKGFGAAFAQLHMVQSQGRGADPESQRLWLEIASSNKFRASDWDMVVDCTGYVPNPLPLIPGLCSRVPYSGELAPPREEATGQLCGFPGLYAVGAPWGELPGRFWGTEFRLEDGFKGEDVIGFQVFAARAEQIAAEILGESQRDAIG